MSDLVFLAVFTANFVVWLLVAYGSFRLGWAIGKSLREAVDKVVLNHRARTPSSQRASIASADQQEGASK